MADHDEALAAAAALMGPDRARALLGCDWGSLVWTVDDQERCGRRARQVMVLHRGGLISAVRVCWRHRARLYAETVPHAGGGGDA